MPPSDAEFKVVDGNEAVARVAYALSELIAIYPITPSSPMAELSDTWSAEPIPNLWGAFPRVIEMQSEGGAAGVLHGALTSGVLATTFTASQGLLLMIPNMFKVAGELTSAVIHVAARTVATHALSIFGDHSDVMAARTTGFAMLASSSVQEAQDLAVIAHMATLEARVPFLHFFDGFRTSHETNKIVGITDEQMMSLVDMHLVDEHRRRGLTPEQPALRGSAQNPDVFFQAREASNPFYLAGPEIVREAMARFEERTGRRYGLFEYIGSPDADRVLVVMGSGCGAATEAVQELVDRGDKVGLIKVRLFRPFSAKDLVALLPRTTREVIVLDRTKEPGAIGEPLYLDVTAALSEEWFTNHPPKVSGGRYGLSSKEFTPAMAAAALGCPKQLPVKRHFTVGIADDVTKMSLKVDVAFKPSRSPMLRSVFYGLGSDGTVGATKATAKILGGIDHRFTQAYSVYDSKKSGQITVSHLRFDDRQIQSSYLIGEGEADIVACHRFSLLRKADVLSKARQGGVFLLNSPFGSADTWARMPRDAQRQVVDKSLRMFAIDADKIARDNGLGLRINTVLQTCFLRLAGIMPFEDALSAIKATIRDSYGKFGEEVVDRNLSVVDASIAELYEVEVRTAAISEDPPKAAVPPDAPDFVQRVLGMIIDGKGDSLPVSAFPPDGTFPTGTARWEKRGLADQIPIWDPALCIDCAKCVLVCPHAALRMKVYESGTHAPDGFRAKQWRGKDFPGSLMSIQVFPDDCTGCELCVQVCPVTSKDGSGIRSINMAPVEPHLGSERRSLDFFLGLPEVDRTRVAVATVKGSQMLEPLFEFSGACAGCGETPYLKLLSQMFGDRLVVANATGCSSIYGGNLPTTPWASDSAGRGPAWSNSLFEDNAEFGLGIRLALDTRQARARALLESLSDKVGIGLVGEILSASQEDEAGIYQQRGSVSVLKEKLSMLDAPEATELSVLADDLLRKSVWLVGGDGWAYDIGFGGLDHVLLSGNDVNILVLDTQVYSNTGGQASKSTPRGAAARFAVAGKQTSRKDLGLIAMGYGGVYVAQVALGGDNAQTVRAFAEAESYSGPSLIIAYGQCIEHGIDMIKGLDRQRAAVHSALWPLYRFDPRRRKTDGNAFILDSGPTSLSVQEFAKDEDRFASLMRTRPEQAALLLELLQSDVDQRLRLYEALAIGTLTL